VAIEEFNLSKPLAIVADENIPEVEAYFSHLGPITRVNGRQLNAQQVRDADLLLVRSVTAVNAELVAGSAVQFVATATIGVDHLDTDYLTKRGIGWANAPGSNANSVVEYVLSSLCSRAGLISALLAGGTVGIVGMGNVGSLLYRRLNALGIRCLAYDPLIAQHSFAVMASLQQVLTADVLCCHAPLSYAGPHPSFHLLGYAQLAQLKTGALLLNAGRGEVIDSLALAKLLSQRSDLTAIVDVWENEPAIDVALLAAVNLATPHIAGYSYDGKLAGTRLIYHACCRYLSLAPQHPSVSVMNRPAGTIVLNSAATVEQGLRQAIGCVYNIAEDDSSLRRELQGKSASERALAFDLLRKNYPRRREFGCFIIGNSDQLSASLQAALVAVGFQLRGAANTQQHSG
jgi:erythronate-4-phosphate dehydrogenase